MKEQANKNHITQLYLVAFKYTRKNLTTCQQDVFATGL
jgi:hypothetical protein